MPGGLIQDAADSLWNRGDEGAWNDDDDDLGGGMETLNRFCCAPHVGKNPLEESELLGDESPT